MMNHEHNPVAVRISRLQEKWIEATDGQPGYNLARWVIHNEDIDFLNGFLKLESSPHGRLEDIFVALFTQFSNQETFTKKLIADWLDMYKQGIEGQTQALVWDFNVYLDKLNSLSDNDLGHDLLIEILDDFSGFASNKSHPLVITLLPRSISDNNSYVKWLASLLNRNDIPPSVKFAIVDYDQHNYFKEIEDIENKQVITITPPNLDLRGAVSELAAMGNPNDSQVQFRICMMKMGEATGSTKRQELDYWGAKLLDVGQRSGDQGTFASAHLIYGGFLMHFPAKEETLQMLQKAEVIAKKAIQQDAKNAVVLIQIYGYLGALASMHGEHKESLKYFINQAALSMEHKLAANAIAAYKTIIYLCHAHGFAEEYVEHVNTGYLLGNEMDDDALSITDYSFIAYHYINVNGHKLANEVTVLEQRMERLFGVDWYKGLDQLFHRVEQQK